MILIDANLLVYAYVRSFPQHPEARGWLDSRLNGETRVGLPWPSLLAFVRLVSNPRIFERPRTVREAWSQVESWLSLPLVWTPLPTADHPRILASLLDDSVTAKKVPDAHLAALAIEHGLTLCSTDRDFAMFPGLGWVNPLSRT